MIQVLVVDDIQDAAVTYAKFIEVRTNLQCLATDDLDLALKKVRTEPIKVAVLDQKMPKKKGTEFYEELKAINPAIKVIMLTGEAEGKEVGEAFRLGFADYLHKSEVEHLPDRVLQLYADYQLDHTSSHRLQNPIPIYVERNLRTLLTNSVSYLIHSIEVIEEEFTFEDRWATVKQINLGEEVKEVDKIEITKRYDYEISDESRLTSKYSISSSVLAKLQINLEGIISSKYKENFYIERKDSIEVTREYKLPPEPSNPNELYVISRRYERAPVYRQIRCLIIRQCKCCETQQPFPILLYQLTSKVATRQWDHFSDGSKRMIETGIQNYN